MSLFWDKQLKRNQQSCPVNAVKGGLCPAALSASGVCLKIAFWQMCVTVCGTPAVYREVGRVVSFYGSVLIFVSMTFILIPEAGCGQSPQSLVNTGNSGNSLCLK